MKMVAFKCPNQIRDELAAGSAAGREAEGRNQLHLA